LVEESSFPDDATSVKEGVEGDAWFGSVAAATQAGLRGNHQGALSKGFHHRSIGGYAMEKCILC